MPQFRSRLGEDTIPSGRRTETALYTDSLGDLGDELAGKASPPVLLEITVRLTVT
jgi:hypothetical protein